MPFVVPTYGHGMQGGEALWAALHAEADGLAAEFGSDDPATWIKTA